MQIIEVSVLGVRSAVYTLRKPGSPLTFVLFPMIHIAEPQFYAAVEERLEACDYIVYEGVRSIHATILTQSYKSVARNERYGLVSQHTMNMQRYAGKLIHGDISSKDFHDEWRQIALWVRLLVYLALPIYIVYMAIWGSRQVLAKYAEVNDLPSHIDIMMSGDEQFDRFEKLLRNKRDAILIQHIRDLDEQFGTQDIRIGVVYGARHMPAVIHFLTGGLHYGIADSEWLMVYGLE